MSENNIPVEEMGNDVTKKACPYCGSDDILPFESESKPQDDDSWFIVMISAFLIIGIYLFFVVSAYLYFPYVLFVFIIIAARMVNRRDKRKKTKTRTEWDYLCVECGSSFRA